MTDGSTDLNSPAQLAGKHVLVLNWRDIKHSQAGGAEQYMHEISRRWVNSGVRVTWFTGRDTGQSAEETIDGIRILRGGGALSIYGQAALRLLRTNGQFDAVVDCQNGIPFFSPLFLRGGDIPIVQLVHHVHQEQFRTRFSPPPMAAVGRFLESSGAKTVYGQRAIVAVSPSTRMELRKLGFRAPSTWCRTVPSTFRPRSPRGPLSRLSRREPVGAPQAIGPVAGPVRRGSAETSQTADGHRRGRS